MPNYFQTKSRDDGSTFVTKRDDCPEWVADVVQESHDNELPNDWRYETCAAIFDAFAEGSEDVSEIADGLTEFRTGALFQWVADYPGRADWADEVASDFGMQTTTADLLRQGQFRCIEAMTETIAQAVEENAEVPA
jgi:hypothetical protein